MHAPSRLAPPTSTPRGPPQGRGCARSTRRIDPRNRPSKRALRRLETVARLPVSPPRATLRSRAGRLRGAGPPTARAHAARGRQDPTERPPDGAAEVGTTLALVHGPVATEPAARRAPTRKEVIPWTVVPNAGGGRPPDRRRTVGSVCGCTRGGRGLALGIRRVRPPLARGHEQTPSASTHRKRLAPRGASFSSFFFV